MTLFQYVLDINKPYRIFVLAAFVTCILSLLAITYVGDTNIPANFLYFRWKSMLWTIPVVLLLLYLLYVVTSPILYSIRFSWLHISFTIVTALFLITTPIFVLHFGMYGAGAPRYYFDSLTAYLLSYKRLDATVQKLLLVSGILMGGQVFYFINLVIEVINKLKKRFA